MSVRWAAISKKHKKFFRNWIYGLLLEEKVGDGGCEPRPVDEFVNVAQNITFTPQGTHLETLNTQAMKMTKGNQNAKKTLSSVAAVKSVVMNHLTSSSQCIRLAK